MHSDPDEGDDPAHLVGGLEGEDEQQQGDDLSEESEPTRLM